MNRISKNLAGGQHAPREAYSNPFEVSDILAVASKVNDLLLRFLSIFCDSFSGGCRSRSRFQTTLIFDSFSMLLEKQQTRYFIDNLMNKLGKTNNALQLSELTYSNCNRWRKMNVY
jgi:hypothetical protein